MQNSADYLDKNCEFLVTCLGYFQETSNTVDRSQDLLRVKLALEQMDGKYNFVLHILEAIYSGLLAVRSALYSEGVSSICVPILDTVDVSDLFAAYRKRRYRRE